MARPHCLRVHARASCRQLSMPHAPALIPARRRSASAAAASATVASAPPGRAALRSWLMSDRFRHQDSAGTGIAVGACTPERCPGAGAIPTSVVHNGARPRGVCRTATSPATSLRRAMAERTVVESRCHAEAPITAAGASAIEISGVWGSGSNALRLRPVALVPRGIFRTLLLCMPDAFEGRRGPVRRLGGQLVARRRAQQSTQGPAQMPSLVRVVAAFCLCAMFRWDTQCAGTRVFPRVRGKGDHHTT